MKIVFAASEVAPFAKTGGLADVLSSLPIEVSRLGHQAMVFLPRYKSVDIDKHGIQIAIKELPVPVGGHRENARIFHLKQASGLTFYFVDHPEYFCRNELYGTPVGDYPDNDTRFIFFQRAVLEALKALKIKPDVIHCHDWQTGLIPVYLKTLYADDANFESTRSIFTIHNLAYQGNFPPDSLPATGLSWDHFKLDRLEFYGKVSFLKGGIVYSDSITTVSPRYAEEIQTKDSGCGLEGVLIRRKSHITGILNGLDYQEWNPETDPDLAVHYSLSKIADKALNKKLLQKENRIKVDDNIPMIGLVSRLVDQKGVDILIAAMDEMMSLGTQFVLLGTGDEKYHQILRDMAKQYRNQAGIHIVFDPKMAKRIYAGCDLLLVPSYYEPCGLAQMIAVRYGTIPIVRRVGGLADTIQEFDPKTGDGNGFCFEDYTGRALMAAVKRSLQVYENKTAWKKLVRNAMQSDFSWTASAKQYIALYEQTKKLRLESEKG